MSVGNLMPCKFHPRQEKVHDPPNPRKISTQTKICAIYTVIGQKGKQPPSQFLNRFWNAMARYQLGVRQHLNSFQMALCFQVSLN